MSLNINQEIFADYCERLGFSSNPRKVTTMHFQKAFAAAASLVAANIHAYEACVVATTTANMDAMFGSNTNSSLPVLKEVFGWKAADMIAKGGYRLATPEENDRYFKELREREQECRRITESSPANMTQAIQRQEAEHTRELISTLVGAAVANRQNEEPERRGPGRPPKSEFQKQPGQTEGGN